MTEAEVRLNDVPTIQQCRDTTAEAWLQTPDRRLTGCATLAGQKRASGLITDGCEPPCGSWELNSGPLEEQPVLSTAEPSLQPMGPRTELRRARLAASAFSPAPTDAVVIKKQLFLTIIWKCNKVSHKQKGDGEVSCGEEMTLPATLKRHEAPPQSVVRPRGQPLFLACFHSLR
ncbi:uncharacterized protein LOC143267692 [Peromyscus maniculatus bairdii]|uniref:uncharacterized protein LOC143267692 n=1 Tax=Peromyscus maniculatus bairdii TaxID=230844 RepID=UPI003FD1E3B8